MKKPRFLQAVPVRLFVALLLVDVLALVLEKMGARAAGTAAGDELAFYLRLAQVPWTWLGIAMGPLQLLIWYQILKRTDLSLAYPVSSLCFPLTMVAAWFFFHEQVSTPAWAGALLITTGVAIVGGRPDKPSATAPDKAHLPLPACLSLDESTLARAKEKVG